MVEKNTEGAMVLKVMLLIEKMAMLMLTMMNKKTGTRMLNETWKRPE